MAKKQEILPYNPSQLMTSGGNGIVDNFNKYRNTPEGKFQFQNMEQNRIAKKNSGRIDYSEIDPVTDVLLGGGLAKGIVNKGLKVVGKNLTEKTVLKNTYKVNPLAFKPTKGMYYHRSPDIVNNINKETSMLQGFANSDAGILRDKLLNEQLFKPRISGEKKVFILQKPSHSDMFFSKDVPLDYGRYNPKNRIRQILDDGTKRPYTGQGYPGPYLIETKGNNMISATQGKRGILPPSIPEGYAVSKTKIPISDAKFYKEDWLRGYKEIPKMKDGGYIMKKYKTQKKSQGGQILNAAGGVASMIPGVGTVVGGVLSGAGMVVDMFAAKKEEEQQRKAEQLLIDKSAMSAMGTGLAKGGEIKGKGTGTSDSIPAKLEKGDFIVPAKNAETALKIRNEHFGDAENKAALKDGNVPVNVSDGEVRFTKDEMDYLDEIGEGSSVRKLAPNATDGKNKHTGGGVAHTHDKNGKVILTPIAKPLTAEEQQLLIDKRNFDWTKKMTINSNRTDNKLLKPYLGGKQLDWNNPVTPKVQTTLSKTTPYTPPGKPSSKFGKFTTENAGAILGATQAIAGLIQGAKNAKQERNLKPIQSNAAIANSEAIDTKRTADQAANAIMAGNTAEADRATGNYMRMAKEAGGANSATVLANAARVGQSSSDSYLKGMTTAAQIRMAGQQAGSEMKIKAGEQATQTAMYNDQATRRLLEAKSANSNNLLSAGLQNTSMAMARADYNKKMADLKATTEHNLNAGKTPVVTPTVSTTTPVTTPVLVDNTKPVVTSGTSATGQLNITPDNPYNIDNPDNLPNEYDRKKPYGMKKGGLVKKYKKSKILSYGR